MILLLDTTPSVVAAGALVSETTMKIGTIVKFSQNVLIGAAALVLSTCRIHADDVVRPCVCVHWPRGEARRTPGA